MERRTSYLVLLFLLSAFAAEKEVSNAETTSDDENDITEKIPPEVIESVLRECEHTLAERRNLERDLERRGRVIRNTDRSADPSLNQRSETDSIVHAREWEQLHFEECTKELMDRYNLTTDEVENDLTRYPVRGEKHRFHRDACERMQPQGGCDAKSKFRTISGWCNNLNNPSWGMAFECQRRLLTANYVGQSDFRISVTGSPLPPPRTLSLNLHSNLDRPTKDVTHMYMFYGQLLDHDFAQTQNSITVDNLPISCCPPMPETHPQCHPILIPENDPFYSRLGITCTNFVRSAICSTCTMGFRQQLSTITSFIDASFVYGSVENLTNSLRENDGSGRLLITKSKFGDLMPQQPCPTEDKCSFPETNDICFLAGDIRANQHTMLASLHTIFLREHNRIAVELKRINPKWDGERIFQEARRIVGALVQVITYKEYLPITLGKKIMDDFQLWISNTGTTAYDPDVDPTLITEFSTAGFRFGHSLVNSVMADSPLNATNGRRLLRNEFFQPFELYNGIIGPLVSGGSRSPAQQFDQHLVPDITNYLYRTRGTSSGLDLASLNINRGRDNGISPYVDLVRYCSDGEIEIREFADLIQRYPNYKYKNNNNNRLMSTQFVTALRRNYKNVSDVDLWPGILMENPNDGAIVGPTAACIIGLQFNRMKFGDRFYFEHRHQAGSFTFQQRRTLKETTLSTIMCLNSDAQYLPSNALLFISDNNPEIVCRNMRGVDLSYWRDLS